MQRYSSCDLVYCVPEKETETYFIRLGRMFKVNTSIVDVIAFSTAIVAEEDLQHVDPSVRETISKPLTLFLETLTNLSHICVGDMCYFDEFVKMYTTDLPLQALDVKRDVVIPCDSDPMAILRPIPGGALTFFVPKLPESFA